MLIEKREYLPPLAVAGVTLSMLLERLGVGILPSMPFLEGLLLGPAFAFAMASITMMAVDHGYE